jgi:hypothetical protein
MSRRCAGLAHLGFQGGPLSLEFFLPGQFLAFGNFLKLRVELRQLRCSG